GCFARTRGWGEERAFADAIFFWRGGRDSKTLPYWGPAADEKDAPLQTRLSSGGEGGIRTRG
ncbi:MAG: hypothetical protein ABSF99_08540, partial [Anaerolineales bacterium]